MTVFYSEGQDWCCPRCKRHILLARPDIDEQERLFALSYAEPRWYVERLQTIACRNCHDIVSIFGLYRAQIGTDGQPQRQPTNHSKIITNHAYRQMVVYPLHLQDAYDPAVVPPAIVQDLQEAASIADLSPRASAVLSRRVVQSVMRDFYKVGKQRDLHSEIEAARSQMSESLYDALMSVKSLGNIGAHPERDVDLIISVDGSEASLLLAVVQILIDGTYVKQADDEQKFTSIKALAEEKRAQRTQQE